MRLIIKIMFFILALTIKANTPTIIQQTEQKYAIEDSIVSIYELEIYNATNPKLKAIIQPPIIFYEKPYLFL